MFQNIEIESLDHFGRGISHLNGKIVFINDALPGEIVDIKIIFDTKKYSEALVLKYHQKSIDRINCICPYFKECGGCSFLNYKYEKTLEFKKNKVRELLIKNKINYEKDIEVIPNINPLNYRNKVSLKIVDGHIGYFKPNSHNLVAINNCIIASNAINEVIKNFLLFHLLNGEITIRSNYNDEILLIINTNEANNIDIPQLKNIVKLVGIIYQNKCIYGTDYFMEKFDGFLFKVSFNSFFQVNHYITSILFKLIATYIDKSARVLDLYSGVGTLSIVASQKATQVYSIEIIKNAVLNGILNAKINQRNNIKFLLGDVAQTIDKIKERFDTLIIDPPRKGIDKKTINFIKKTKPNKIIYISCEANTLMRDLKLLEGIYLINDYKILDMFSYTYHVETVCLLERKTL